MLLQLERTLSGWWWPPMRLSSKPALMMMMMMMMMRTPGIIIPPFSQLTQAAPPSQLTQAGLANSRNSTPRLPSGSAGAGGFNPAAAGGADGGLFGPASSMIPGRWLGLEASTDQQQVHQAQCRNNTTSF